MQKSYIQYMLYFALCYIGVTILFAIISSFISSAGSSGTVLSPFLAALFVSQIFIKNEMRAPNNQERNRLTLYSMGVYLVINAALVALVLSTSALGNVIPGDGLSGSLFTIFAVVFGIIFLLIFFMMRWAYGGLARKHAKKTLGDLNNTFD